MDLTEKSSLDLEALPDFEPEPEPQPEPQPEPDNNQSFENTIDTGLILYVADKIICNIAAIAFNFFSKDENIEAKYLHLSDKDIKKLSPICDRLAEKYKTVVKDEYLLIYMLIAAYGSNFMVAKMQAKPKKTTVKPVKTEQNNGMSDVEYFKNGKPKKQKSNV